MLDSHNYLRQRKNELREIQHVHTHAKKKNTQTYKSIDREAQERTSPPLFNSRELQPMNITTRMAKQRVYYAATAFSYGKPKLRYTRKRKNKNGQRMTNESILQTF